MVNQYCPVLVNFKFNKINSSYFLTTQSQFYCLKGSIEGKGEDLMMQFGGSATRGQMKIIPDEDWVEEPRMQKDDWQNVQQSIRKGRRTFWEDSIVNRH